MLIIDNLTIAAAIIALVLATGVAAVTASGPATRHGRSGLHAPD